MGCDWPSTYSQFKTITDTRAGRFVLFLPGVSSSITLVFEASRRFTRTIGAGGDGGGVGVVGYGGGGLVV